MVNWNGVLPAGLCGYLSHAIHYVDCIHHHRHPRLADQVRPTQIGRRKGDLILYSCSVTLDQLLHLYLMVDR